MRYALISDIHANLPALEAVLTDISGRPEIDATYHLGDLVGYAPGQTRRWRSLSEPASPEWPVTTTAPWRRTTSTAAAGMKTRSRNSRPT